MNSKDAQNNTIQTTTTMDQLTNQNFKEIISDVVESMANERVTTQQNYDMYQQQTNNQESEASKVSRNNLIARKKIKPRRPHHPPAQIPSTDPNKNNKPRTYFRAPGLKGPTENMENSHNLHVCQICGFSCSSIFHYNSHMNTHGYHKCLMCNYTARTEGRLKKHMKTSHSRADRISVGLDKYTDEELAKRTENKDSTPQKDVTTSTTMAAIVAMVNQAAAANTDTINGNNNGNIDLQRLVDDLSTNQTNQFNGTTSSVNLASLLEFAHKNNNILGPSALESIRALTERSSLTDILAMGNPQSDPNKGAIDDLEEAESVVNFFL